jgi:hypothetical protein
MRKQKGLSQDDLAFQAGINRNDVSQIEREKINEPMDVGFPDADAPGVLLKDFLLAYMSRPAHSMVQCTNFDRQFALISGIDLPTP